MPSHGRNAGSTPMPGWKCVAPPADDLVPDPMTGRLVPRGYRGADHMMCTHPTPPPQGHHWCQGDSGCTILIQAGRFCVMHGDLSDDLSPADRAKPACSTTPKPAHRIWAMTTVNKLIICS